VNGVLNTTKKKSKDYYTFLISKKALSPCNGQKLKCESELSDTDLVPRVPLLCLPCRWRQRREKVEKVGNEVELKQAFSLPYSIAFEPYVKAFQF